MSYSTCRVAASPSLLSTAESALQNPQQNVMHDDHSANDPGRSSHSVQPAKNPREIRETHSADERHCNHQAEGCSGQISVTIADQAENIRKHRGKPDTEQEDAESCHRNRLCGQQQCGACERDRETDVEHGEWRRLPKN